MKSCAPTNFFDALKNAHMPNPNVPKVKVTLFKPSQIDLRQLPDLMEEDNLAAWTPKPDIRSPFNSDCAGLDCVEPDGSSNTKGNLHQLEGLVKCRL